MLRAIRFLAIVFLFLPVILAPQAAGAVSLDQVREDLTTLDKLDLESGKLFGSLADIQEALPARDRLAYYQAETLVNMNASYISRSRSIGSLLYARYFLMNGDDAETLEKMDELLSSHADLLWTFNNNDLNGMKEYEPELRNRKIRGQLRRLRKILRRFRKVLERYRTSSK